MKRNNEKKSDRRVTKTRRAIMDAFNNLITQGDAGKITVSAIAREADIDRKTFYLHFSSVDDLANHKAEESIERVLDALVKKGGDKDGAERLHIVLEETNKILTSELTAYSNIASRISTDQMLSYFEHAMGPAFSHAGLTMDLLPSPEARMQLEFYLAGAWALYASWLKSDHSTPIENVSTIIERAIEATFN